MAQTVMMPKLGNTVESCVIVSWKVAPGQKVGIDTIICEIETDKATMDVPAGVEGTVLKLLASEGDDVPVLTPIALVGEAGEVAAASAQAQPEAAALASIKAAPPAMPTQPAAAASTPAFVPSVQAVPFTASIPAAISPRARVLAQKEGLPITSIRKGSGPGGRIIERDILAALAAKPVRTPVSAPPETKATAAQAAPDSFTETPIRGIRKIISERMMSSLSHSAQLTLNSSAPAARLLALRDRFKNAAPELGFSGITIGDLVAFAAARTLLSHPDLNAHVVEGTVRKFSRVHLGLAVDTPRGLMVPVVRDAASMTLKEFSGASKALAKACVSGTANPDDLSGSTFTVTNLGAFGIESFTPILNEPETAILGVCAIVPRPAPAAEGGAFEMRIGFSLTVDHRVVDGAAGARFLRDLAACVAEIDVALLG